LLRTRSISSSSRNLDTSETDYRRKIITKKRFLLIDCIDSRIGDGNWDKPQALENYNRNASERKRMLIPTPKSHY